MRRLRRTAGAALALAALTAAPATAAQAPALARVGAFAQPVGVTGPADDASRLFVVERAGRIVVLHDGRRATFLDLTAKVKSDGYEQGLLGLALAPDYTRSGEFYIYYTAPAPDGGEGSDVVVSVLRRRDAAHADPASERVLLRIPHRLEQYENGGGLTFGPDGLLWIGTGDGGGEWDAHGNAQRLDPATDDPAQGADALLGKLLRIDPALGDGCGGACTIPSGNPGFAQREVWAYGLRNPWRFSFDRATGDLVVGDVGQGRAEEVDLGRAPDRARGANFGWPLYEGSAPTGRGAPAAGCCVPPVLERAHGGDEAFDAIIGGVVVRDPGLPALAGRYLYAGTGTGHVHAVDLAAPGDDRDTGLAAAGLTSFGEDACGRVYVTTFGGDLDRLTQGVAAGCPAGAPDPTVAAAARQRALRRRAVRVTVRCAAACAATARGSLRGSAAGLRTATAAARVEAGGRATLTLRLSARVRATVARSLRRGRRVTVAVTVTARPAAGGAAGVQRAYVSARIVG